MLKFTAKFSIIFFVYFLQFTFSGNIIVNDVNCRAFGETPWLSENRTVNYSSTKYNLILPSWFCLDGSNSLKQRINVCNKMLMLFWCLTVTVNYSDWRLYKHVVCRGNLWISILMPHTLFLALCTSDYIFVTSAINLFYDSPKSWT